MILAVTLILGNGSSTYAYKKLGYEYPGELRKNLTYYVSSSTSKYSKMIGASARTWNGIQGVYWKRTNNIEKSNMVTQYSKKRIGAYAVCYYDSRKRKRIVIYKDFESLDNIEKKETLVHEIGHALGLDHTQYSKRNIAVMRREGFNRKPRPLSDDIKGIKNIYKRGRRK